MQPRACSNMEKRKKRLQHMTENIHCMFPNCNTTSLHNKIIVPSAEMQPQFSEVLNTQQPVTICATHYRQVHSQSTCAGCGAKPKFRQPAYTRHSPDAIAISQYLNERTGFDSNFTVIDTFCESCYDMHLVILRHIEK